MPALLQVRTTEDFRLMKIFFFGKRKCKCLHEDISGGAAMLS